MGAESQGVGGITGASDAILKMLRGKYVASGDLAAIALAVGGAREVSLVNSGDFLYITGRFDFEPTYNIYGYWKPLRRRRFAVKLTRVSYGYWGVDWGVDYTYLKVGPTIEVVVNGAVVVSRPNICAMAESIGGRGDDRHVVVHILGTIMVADRVMYTAFRCSEWILPIDMYPFFERFAFNKKSVRNSITELPVEFRELFLKRGRVVKVLINPSCTEYTNTVYRLYGTITDCKD